MSDKKLDSAESQACYCFGWQIGMKLKGSDFDGFDMEAVKQGMDQAFAGEQALVSEEQLQQAFSVVGPLIEKRREALAEAKAAPGVLFLNENAERAEVTVLESGLQYEVLVEGDGAKPSGPTDTVKVHYEGRLIDGTVFDSSIERGQPAEFPLNRVVAGWTEGLQLMSVGSKYKLYLPHQLAYGPQGSQGAIPPYAALVFEVELLEVKPAEAA